MFINTDGARVVQHCQRQRTTRVAGEYSCVITAIDENGGDGRNAIRGKDLCRNLTGRDITHSAVGFIGQEVADGQVVGC